MRRVLRVATFIFVMVCSTLLSSAQVREARAVHSEAKQVNSSIESKFRELKSQQSELQGQIKELEGAIQGASKSKARKLSKELEETKGELEVINRIIESYPLQLRDPNYTPDTSKEEAFKDEIERLGVDRAVKSDPYSKPISSDSELEKLYREYLKDQSYKPTVRGIDGHYATPNANLYRIVLAAIEGREPTKTPFEGLSDIYYRKADNNTIIYYQGNYKSYQEAKAALEGIKHSGRFLDAFIVKQ